MIDRFYMCLAENGTHPPRHRHSSPEAAKQEAERLARTIGGKVHVLASVASVEKTDVRWEKHEPVSDDDIPF
jgi:hypothetical protein